MKKCFLAIIIASCGLFSSCEDFIEHEQRGVQNLDNYFQTDTECQEFVNDLYKRAFCITTGRPCALHVLPTRQQPMMHGWEIPDRVRRFLFRQRSI